jgi:hypothetical protein
VVEHVLDQRRAEGRDCDGAGGGDPDRGEAAGGRGRCGPTEGGVEAA